MALKFKRLENGGGLPLPAYQSRGAAGMDICAAEDATLYGHNIVVVPTGFAVEIPGGYEIQVRPRSGLAVAGITVVNSPGTIDCDYRGEIKIILGNMTPEVWHFNRGDRIAQLVVAPVSQLGSVEVTDLSVTERGSNGFGSTGL